MSLLIFFCLTFCLDIEELLLYELVFCPFTLFMLCLAVWMILIFKWPNNKSFLLMASEL